MTSICKSLALGCAFAVAGCAQSSLGGSPGAFGPSGLSALPATSSAGRAPAFAVRGRHDTSTSPLLYDFTGDPDGGSPYAGLANVGGTLYGTTYQGGTNNLGTIFSITTGGKETVVHSFAGSDGEYPVASLVNVNGTLYGTAPYATGATYGDVFSYNPASGKFNVVYSFQSYKLDGDEPVSDLTYARGALYGTTEEGGNAGYGTVYKVQLSGKKRGHESIVYNFQGSIDSGPDGALPRAGVLYHGGSLYGTTYSGGTTGNGTIFSISLATGKEKVLHSFGTTVDDGLEPQADLMFYKNALYGTDIIGGPTNPQCGGTGCGTVFRYALAGKYKILYAFNPHVISGSKTYEDGSRPLAGLINVDGIFYGTTYGSWPDGDGTVFSVSPTGAEQVILVLGGCPSCGPWPASPAAALIDVGGVLYGTSLSTAGEDGLGTVFDLPI
jgi:uncharacterized repeat protein (TIGR03803 family)